MINFLPKFDILGWNVGIHHKIMIPNDILVRVGELMPGVSLMVRGWGITANVIIMWSSFFSSVIFISWTIINHAFPCYSCYSRKTWGPNSLLQHTTSLDYPSLTIGLDTLSSKNSISHRPQGTTSNTSSNTE